MKNIEKKWNHASQNLFVLAAWFYFGSISIWKPNSTIVEKPLIEKVKKVFIYYLCGGDKHEKEIVIRGIKCGCYCSV